MSPFHKGKFGGVGFGPIIKITERIKGSHIEGLTKNTVSI